MTRAKELLDAATPLPWQYFPDDGEGDELQDGNGEMIASGFRDWVFLEGKPIAKDAALIVYAVNALPAYEAAVELLEKVMPFVDNLEARDAIREALRRLQEPHPHGCDCVQCSLVL